MNKIKCLSVPFGSNVFTKGNLYEVKDYKVFDSKPNEQGKVSKVVKGVMTVTDNKNKPNERLFKINKQKNIYSNGYTFKLIIGCAE